MLSSDANIVPDPSARTLTVLLHHALAPLLGELNQTRTPCPGTNLHRFYEILPHDSNRFKVANSMDTISYTSFTCRV